MGCSQDKGCFHNPELLDYLQALDGKKLWHLNNFCVFCPALSYIFCLLLKSAGK